jgi:multidrug resistance efflux pump
MNVVRMNGVPLLMVTCLWAVGDRPARGDEPAATKAAGEKTASSSKPATHKVERGPFKIEATLKGVIEAENTTELSIKPEAWTMPLTINAVIDHGTRVKKGDVLVELDHEKIDQAIKDLKIERAIAELARQQAEDELPILEKFLPLDLAAAERAKTTADEDLQRFLDIDRAQSERSAEFMVKSGQQYLAYAREELNQLQKMYRSKDLTEDTEEMILKRQRFQVEQSEYGLKNSEIQRDTTLKVTLPRQEQQARDTAAKQTLALQKAKIVLPLELNQKRLTLARLKSESQKGAERLANLEKDREAMTIRAPADGVVYYGQSVRGQWSTAGVAPRLRRGGAIMPEEVFMTIVSVRPFFIRASVEEKDLHALWPEMKGKAVPAGFPDMRLPAHLVRFSTIPYSAGSFEARVAVELGDDATLMPGMSCTVTLTSVRKDDALLVPTTAVFHDESNDDAAYVYVNGQGTKAEKKSVKVGKNASGKTEILEGLREGDEILASKP